MRYFEIKNTKSFMASLLTKDTFRDFELSSAQITTFMTCTIDGMMHEGYLAEKTGARRLTPWSLAAPVIVSIIRGKTQPLSMKIILRLGDEPAGKLMSKADLTFSISDIKGLFLNISCDREKVTCVTGTSLSVFTTDKSAEHMWDDAAERFLGSYLEA